ncbi:hypothetical protein K525DRAFT_285344 [Schizophyllum commune Loenen D]|nr:hypothetical protein K525DRAFT_285344 [Schizophyllum commune Loenen D]
MKCEDKMPTGETRNHMFSAANGGHHVSGTFRMTATSKAETSDTMPSGAANERAGVHVAGVVEMFTTIAVEDASSMARPASDHHKRVWGLNEHCKVPVPSPRRLHLSAVRLPVRASPNRGEGALPAATGRTRDASYNEGAQTSSSADDAA